MRASLRVTRLDRKSLFASIIFGAAVTLPVLPSQGHLSFHDSQRTVECLVLCVAALWVFFGGERLPNLGLSTRRCFGALAFIILAACWHAEYVGAAFQEAALWVGLIGWAALCHQSALRAEEKFILRAAVLSMLAYAVLVFVLYGMALGSGQPLDARGLIVGFDNPRFLNHVQTVAVPLLWMTAASDSKKWWRRIALVAAILHIALATLVIARATLLAWIVALAVLTAIRERPIRQQGWLCVLLGLACAAVTFFVVPVLLDLTWNPSFAAPKEVGSTHSRDVLWRLAFEQALQSPWLGAGPMHFAAQLNAKAAHPHNVYLQLAAEIGILGALLFLGLLVAPILEAIKRLRHQTGSPLLAAGVVAAIAAMVDAGLSGNFVMPLSQLWIATAWGLLTGALARRVAPSVEPVDQCGLGIRRIAVGGLLATQLGLCAIAAAQLSHDPPRIRADSPLPAAGVPYHPRFWLSGWI